MVRIRKEPEERRAEILAAASRLFEERGYHTVSIEEIAKAAGLARSSIYEYFPKKEEIGFELLSGLTGIFNKLELRGKKPEKKLFNLLEDIFELTIEHQSLLDLYYDSTSSWRMAYRVKVSEWQRVILNRLFELFQAENKLRMSASKAAYLSLSLVQQRIFDVVVNKTAINPGEEAELIAAFISKGTLQ